MRRDSVSPVKRSNEQQLPHVTWTIGADMQIQNRNSQIQNQQQQAPSYFYRSPANFRNASNDISGGSEQNVSSIERHRQLQAYHRNDGNTSYYSNMR